MSSQHKITLSEVSRQRIVDAIAVHEAIMKRHGVGTETHRYAKASIALLRAELARRDRGSNRREIMTQARVCQHCGVIIRKTAQGWRHIRRSGCTRAEPRKLNPHKKSPRKHSPRAKQIITTTTQSVKRISNRRGVVLMASKRGRHLRYVGHGRFTAIGRGVRFPTAAAARAVARVLRSEYPAALRGYRLHVQ